MGTAISPLGDMPKHRVRDVARNGQIARNTFAGTHYVAGPKLLSAKKSSAFDRYSTQDWHLYRTRDPSDAADAKCRLAGFAGNIRPHREFNNGRWALIQGEQHTMRGI
jgi:hypothetical protein